LGSTAVLTSLATMWTLSSGLAVSSVALGLDQARAGGHEILLGVEHVDGRARAGRGFLAHAFER